MSSLHILKERILVFICILNLCVSLFSPPSTFSQKLFFPNLLCFSYSYRGRKLFLKFVLFIGWVASIFYRADFFCVPLVLYFLLSSVVHVYCLPSYWVVFVNTWQKGGEIDEIWEILFKRFLNCFYLAGDEIVFEMGRK